MFTELSKLITAVFDIVSGIGNTTFYRRVVSIVVMFFFPFVLAGSSMAGSGFSDQGNALFKALNEHLISKGICKDNRNCHNVHQIFREDSSKHIYLNMYGQSDGVLVSIITEFLVTKGLKITNGMPITLRVFSGPHEQYEGLKRMLGQNGESIKLEIHK